MKSTSSSEFLQFCKIRKANLGDIGFIMKTRILMFLDMGRSKSEVIPLQEAWQSYFSQAIPNHQYHGWIVSLEHLEQDNLKDIASGGVILDKHPPSPRNPNGIIGYILNVYTFPDYRRRGVARYIMETILSWLETNNINIASLHASEQGRTLYKRLGFSDTQYMSLKIRKKEC